MINNLVSPYCLEYLKSEYSGEKRLYHNWDHVESMLKWTKIFPYAPELTLAALFHDAVYDPMAKDNEERSVDMMRSIVTKSKTRDLAEECILYCKKPFSPSELAPAIFTDIDYSILGSDRITYMHYMNAICEEYCIDICNKDAYINGRLSFLNSMKDRFNNTGKIFNTRMFNDMLGLHAIGNISAEIEYLQLHQTK